MLNPSVAYYEISEIQNLKASVVDFEVSTCCSFTSLGRCYADVPCKIGYRTLTFLL